MNGEHHERALRLVDARAVEGLSPADREWLGTHLKDCAACSAHAQSVARTIESLHWLPVELDPAVVARTRARVRLRAHELEEHRSRMRALGMACGLSWLLGVVSAPLLWWGIQWIGERLAVPEPARIAVFVFTWTGPATVVAVLLAWRRFRNSGAYGSEMPGAPR